MWAKKTLTNNGPYHQEFEQKLCAFLGVKYISLFTNGTIALIAALRALSVSGEVITTPYSFVATAHSLLWNGITPVFVDIAGSSFNIDANKIRAAITPDTTAILPVHCYGGRCDVVAIQGLAEEFGLKVIYDAAHAFGVKDQNGSILNYGDMSVLSFHATKVFNTFEGGAVISSTEEQKRKIDHLKNFGFVDEVTVIEIGINGKMSEFNSAVGLLQLNYFEQEVDSRKRLDANYRELLSDLEGIEIPGLLPENMSNYSYFPILINDDYLFNRDEIYDKLQKENIFARRYFYPLISNFPMYENLDSASKDNLPDANRVANKVICLPLYGQLKFEEQQYIASILRGEEP